MVFLVGISGFYIIALDHYTILAVYLGIYHSLGKVDGKHSIKPLVQPPDEFLSEAPTSTWK